MLFFHVVTFKLNSFVIAYNKWGIRLLFDYKKKKHFPSNRHLTPRGF